MPTHMIDILLFDDSYVKNNVNKTMLYSYLGLVYLYLCAVFACVVKSS